MQPQSSSHKFKVKHNPRNPTKALQNLHHGAGFHFDPIGSGYRKNRDKGKARARSEDEDEGTDEDGVGGEFTLLALPHTLIPQILSLLPPRSLLPLRSISSLFCSILDEDSVWRDSYVNRFVVNSVERASISFGQSNRPNQLSVEPNGQVDEERSPGQDRDSSSFGSDRAAEGLVRSCVGDGSGGIGWKREALSRESMLDRFIHSKSPTIVHSAHIDIITSLSLFYTPPQQQAMPVRSGHGSTRNSFIAFPSNGPAQTATPSATTTNGIPSHGASSSSPTTTKLIGAKHRQPHRSPGNDPTGFGGTGGMGRAPNTVCVGMNAGVAVRADPLVGKTLQGWLGPGQVSTLGHVAPVPSCSFTPALNPAFVLWGLQSGHVMLSTLLNPLPHPGRLSGPIAACSNIDAHALPVRCVWAPPLSRPLSSPEDQRFISGSEDGRIRIWKHDQPHKKHNGHGPGTAGSLVCIFTSPVISRSAAKSAETFGARAPRPSLGARPDPIVIVRWEVESGLIIVASESGGLWLISGWEDLRDVDDELLLHCLLEPGVGALEPSRLEFFSTVEAGADDGARLLSVLFHARGSASLSKLTYRTMNDGSATLLAHITVGVLGNSAGILSLYVDFELPLSISLPTNLVPADFSAEVVVALASGSVEGGPSTPSRPGRTTEPLSQARGLDVSRVVIAGCADGRVHIWNWDSAPKQIGSEPTDLLVCPTRSWAAGDGTAITTVTHARSLVATGDAHGNVCVWDALDCRPVLLRTLRNRHGMTPSAYPDVDKPESLAYSVNAIILEADTVVATVGTHVMGWRAGNRKAKDGKSAWKGQVLGKHSNGKTSPAKGYDAKHLKTVVAESKSEIEAEQDELRAYHQSEALMRCELDTLGLEDSDEAFQYALMISQGETSRRSSEAEFQAGEEEDDVGLREALEAIRRAECKAAGSSEVTSASATAPISRNSAETNTGVSVRYSELTEEQELAVALEQIKLAEEAEAGRSGAV